MITQEDLKTIRERGYSDDEIWSKLAETNSDFSIVKERGYSLEEVASITSGKPMPEPEPADTSIGDTLQTAAEELEAGVGRAGSAFAKSAVGSVRMFTDLFGANNKVSKEIAGVEDYIDQFTTAQAKQDKEEISRLFQEAEGKGLGNKVMAGLKAVAVSPETLGPEMAGYMLPSLAAGLLTGGASIPVQIGAQATIGAAQAAGSIKGDIYQSVRDYSREQGLSEVEADRAATEAQSYGGKNLDLILTNAGIGALAASTGAERIATRILTGRGKDVTKKTLGEFLKQGAAAGGVEAGTEGIEEAAQQISKNIALQREGKDVPTFQNVPQVATMGAVAGGVIGGGLKGVEFLSAEEKAEQDINRSADREARSLSATDSTTKKVINDLNQFENAIDSLRQELDTLEPTDPKAQQLRMRISEEQKKATGLKQSLGEEFLSEPITTIEEQQAALAKTITAPAEPKPLPTDVLPTETPGATYGREEQVYDVFGDITRKPVAIPKPAELPAAPTIEEQTAEGTYGGQTGVFDVFAGARRKPVVTEQAAPAEAPAPEVAPAEIEAVHFSRTPMKLEKGVDISKIKGAYEEYSTFGRGFYAAEKADESMWKGMDRFQLGDFRNEVKITPKNPLIISPQTIKELGYDAIKNRIDKEDYDAIITRGWDVDTTEKIEKRIDELWKPKFPSGKTSGKFTNVDEYRAANEQAIKEITGLSEYDYTNLEKQKWNQNQIFIPQDIAPDVVSPTPAVSETITEPKSDVRYNPLGYDIADVVEDIKQGKTSTPLKAVNQVIKESTDLRKRVAAESTRRQQPRKMGKAAILERIARERSAGNINENTGKALTDFINRVNDDAIWDTAISIRAKGVSNYDFADNLVTFFLNQDKGDFGASVGIHEFWHGLSRFLPDAEVEKINNDYTKELADYLKKNPWFLAFVGRYSLTPEQFEAYKFFNPKEAETKLTPVKDEQGNIVKYKINFDKDNYRYIMLDEFIAEKMTDLVLGKQQEPNTFLGKLAKVLREFMALIKARLGVNPYEKFYQAVTSTDGKLVLQRETGVAPAMQIYDPVEYDYSTRRIELQTQDARFAELEARAKAGDKEAEAEAQRMVDEASGNRETFYRGQYGTRNDFTGKGPVFFTSSEFLAAGYARSGGYKEPYITSQEAGTPIRSWEAKKTTTTTPLPPTQQELETYKRMGLTESDIAFNNMPSTSTEVVVVNSQTQAEQLKRKGWDIKELPITFQSGPLVQSAKLFIQNPLIIDAQGAIWNDIEFEGSKRSTDDLAQIAINNGYDGLIVKNVRDSFAGMRENMIDDVYAVFNPEQIKSADPFTYDDAGNLIPLSERFQSSEPDIRRMAVEAEPDKEQIMSQEVGQPKTTPEGIIAKTKELLRKQFDPAKVSVNNTTEAFRALGRLTGKDANAFAQELNDIGRLVDKSGAASEISMGAALFVNDLFEYSIRLAAEGDSKMLGIMIANINKLPTAGIGASDAGRTLRARLELSQRFRMMGDAEQDAYTNYVAEFIYGPNPSKDQIQSIKDAYAAVEKTPQVTEQELTDEIKAVGDRTGTDLVGKINEEFTKATEKGKEKRRTEEQELDREYKKVQRQADAEIEKLAKIQSDTPSFDPAVRQVINEVRAIVANDLKQRPDMESKADWKSALIAKLQQVGVEPAAAETLADIVWRQHEINNLSRELSSINKAIEKGPISEIVKAIKETPLEDQQNPNWRYEVMRDYLRKAGLNVAQSERIAKLMDISLQKRFTMAQEQAFTDAISKTAPWKSGDTRSRRAFQKVLQALRAGALDPARNVLSDMAALNGWTGFTPEQYKDLLKYDAILADPKTSKADLAEAHKAIQNIISKAKLPIRARDVIGQYYDAQALSGIQTMTVNIFSPAGMAAKNALVQSLNGLVTARPEQITAAMTTFVDSIKSWANTVAYSFKNNVTVYSNVEYLVNDEGLLKLYKKGVDQFKGGKTPRERADGVKNMMIGMMDYVRRILNALDYGAIASLQNQAVSKYALAAMQAKGMSSADGTKMLNAMMEQKRIFYTKQIAIGTDKNKAAVLADEFFISAWRQALTDAKLPAQEVMDAALNDSMSAVGRNRQSLDAFLEEETNIRDEGLLSFPAIWLLETMANAANRQDSQFIKIFSRVIYGFAIVPARVLRETAWFSPIGAYRFAYDAIAKKMGFKNRYAQSLGNDLQYRQRLTETITGSLVMLAFAAAMSASTDDEEDKKPFKIVVTGNGPLRNEDPQFYDSWMKKNRPNTVSVYFGKTKFTLNTMRGFEAFAWPAMMLGAVDDWHIRRKQKRTTNTPLQMQDAAIVAGNVLSASLRRGPYAFAAKPLFEAYGDRGVESLAKSLAFPAKTIIPVLGSSLASNISNFLNEPVDRRTLEGALWANIPFIGPAVAPKSLNAFGEPALSNDAADKIFKLGVPIVFDIPNDRQSVMLHELVLKQGGGPSIPTRNQLAQRLDRQPTNKEFEMFVKEYGSLIAEDMKANYTDLFEASAEGYSKYVEKIGNVARDIAETRVREKFEKP